MATSLVQKGEVITVPSPGSTAGVGLLIGQLFGIAETTSLSGQQVALRVTGVVRIAKDTNLVISAGDVVYWVPASN